MFFKLATTLVIQLWYATKKASMHSSSTMVYFCQYSDWWL